MHCDPSHALEAFRTIPPVPLCVSPLPIGGICVDAGNSVFEAFRSHRYNRIKWLCPDLRKDAGFFP